MLLLTLRDGDGLSRGRPELESLVRRLQRALVEAGHPLKVDGQFGTGTEKALKAFQVARGVPPTGRSDPATWAALKPFLDRLYGSREALIAEQLEGFLGDLDWVHGWEGHRGRPYWPGGQSGVTLDPGVDLGQVEFALVERLYGPLLDRAQRDALRAVAGLTGSAAEQALAASPVLRGVRVSSDDADRILPVAARPYWTGISRRFNTLPAAGTPRSVQTVLLSLAYNRGVNNRFLDALGEPLAAGSWRAVASRVGAMQQRHQLEGIRRRRRFEAALILAELAEIDA